MAPAIGRRWRPICGLAPYASVPGRDRGKLTGQSSPFSTSAPEGRSAVGSRGIRAVAVGTIGRVHLRARRLPPVNGAAGPSERARIRIPGSAPIRSLLNVKAATLRHASKSPIQTAPAERPATPRLPGFVEGFILRRVGVMPAELTSLWLVSGAG